MASEEEQAAAAALEKAKEEHALIVADVIKGKALSEEKFKGLIELGKGLNNGDSLKVQVLSGSQTNFTYKISLTKDPSKAVFAKISFEFALWNPDRSQKYDLSRATNEFIIVEKFSKLFGGYEKAPVAEPYYCLDLPGDQAGKISISEWSAVDSQFAGQFREGVVDPRVLKGVAQALAKLNLLTPVDPSWNEESRECMRSLHPLFKQIFGQFVNVPDSEADVCIQYCKELGLDRLEQLVDELDDVHMNSRQVLCHSDPKQFNVLTEKRDEPGKFGPTGNWVIVDWEMTQTARSGKDPGVFQAWTIACAYCHAAKGNKKEAHHLQDCVMHFWNDYETALREAGKDDAYILDALRGSLGFTCLYGHMAYYMLGIDREGLPLEDMDDNAIKKALGSLGKTSLQLGEISFLGKFDSLGVAQLKMFMAILLDGEIDSLLQYSENQTNVVPRRPTMVAQNIMSRRLSTDKHLVELAARRASQVEVLNGRASVYGKLPTIPQEILDLADDDED